MFWVLLLLVNKETPIYNSVELHIIHAYAYMSVCSYIHKIFKKNVQIDLNCIFFTFSKLHTKVCIHALEAYYIHEASHTIYERVAYFFVFKIT